MLNEYYKNLSLLQFVKRYGIVNAFRRGIFLGRRFHFVGDYEVRKLLWQKKVTKLICKYEKFRNNDTKDIEYGDQELLDPIWIYWSSGIDNAPEIVKACYFSVRERYGDRVILLSDDNITEYVKLPRIIEEKREKGLLTLAHYSDLLRFAILAHFGGLWLDSTVYLSNLIPEKIFNSDFFVLQNSLGLITNPVLYPVWFIRAKKGNDYIRKIRNIAFAYYSNERHVIEYLASNIIVTRVVGDNDHSMPYMASDYSEYLVKCLPDEYRQDDAEWIFGLTSIHKLTYKLDDRIAGKNTIYDFIINDRKGSK